MAVLITAIPRLLGLRSPVYMDEAHILVAVSHFITNRTFIPPWFDWPPLFAYLGVPATALVSGAGGLLTGLRSQEWAILESAFVSPGIVLGTRLLSLVFSLGTVWILWESANRDSGPLGTLGGVLVFALSPVEVRYGAWGLPESGMAFGVAAATYCALTHLKSGESKWLLRGGAFAGLAAAFKYNGILALAACGSACFAYGGRRNSKAGVGAVVASIVVFLGLCPTWVVVPRLAMEGFLFETRHVSAAGIGPMFAPYVGVPQFLFLNEPGLLLGLIAGLVLLCVARNARLCVLLSVPLATLLAVGGWARMDSNYWIPALPGVSLLLGEALSSIRHVSWRRACTAFAFVLLVGGLLAISPPPVSSDNRDRMALWLAENMPQDAHVIRHGGYTPKVWGTSTLRDFLTSNSATLSPRARAEFFKRLVQQPRAETVTMSEEMPIDNAKVDFESGIRSGDWLLISSLPIERIRKYPPPESPTLRSIYDKRKAFYEDLFGSTNIWKMIHEEKGGAGQAQYAFLKQP